MRDLRKGTIRPDSDVIFYDGILYIISETGEDNDILTVDRKFLDGEYDEPLSLEDIAKNYPNVRKVIFDDQLKGVVFNYGNHRMDPEPEMWELVGETLGYA